MPMEENLVARLSALATGATVDWFDRPRGSFPAIVLTKVSPGRDWTMDGPDGLDEPRVQIDCWSRRKDEAAGLARSVLAELEQERTVGTTLFHPASLESERYAADDLDGGGVAYRVQQDFMFYHQEV